MLKNIVLGGLSIVALYSAFLAWGYKEKNVNLSEELSSAKMRLEISESNLKTKSIQLEQALAARAVLQSHLDRTAADAEHWEQVAAELLEKDGADEALNDYERGILDRLLAP